MRLVDLSPRWINHNFFIFKCPHCQSIWLTCKNVVMTRREVWDVLEVGLGERWNETVVPPNPTTTWNIEGNFENLTITPSIDASASGHWHGFITNGEIK